MLNFIQRNSTSAALLDNIHFSTPFEIVYEFENCSENIARQLWPGDHKIAYPKDIY